MRKIWAAVLASWESRSRATIAAVAPTGQAAHVNRCAWLRLRIDQPPTMISVAATTVSSTSVSVGTGTSGVGTPTPSGPDSSWPAM